MSAPPDHAARRADFTQRLRRVGATLDAAGDIDDIMLDLSSAICELFGADRLSIYAVGDDKASLVSRVKTGLTSFKQLKLPISADSIAGYAALSRRTLNLRDVYDEQELMRHAPSLRFQQGVDRRTGYRTREMLVAPIDDDGGTVLGVLQLINNRAGGPFPAIVEDGVRELAPMLAAALKRKGGTPLRERGRFAALLPEALLSRAQLDHALRLAGDTRDIEDVLIDEIGIKTVLVGRALADFYAMPYFTFDSAHRRPVRLLEQFRRADVLRQQWMPIVDGGNGLFVLAVDPDRARADGAVARAFPGARPVWCVTTRREFASMVAQFFGDDGAPPEPPAATAPTAANVPGGLATAVGELARQAHSHGIRELHIETTPGDAPGEVRFQVTGILVARDGTGA
nr:GAF domain-containing protein [uncultured Duganella sp.]